MSEWFDYNPDTGVTEYFDYDDNTGDVTIHMEQDVSALLEETRRLRNDRKRDRGIKESWWQYAIIPTTVQVELRNKGVDIMSKDPQMLRRVYREINQNYPYLKTTDKTHNG